jgi:hypothetical protein
MQLQGGDVKVKFKSVTGATCVSFKKKKERKEELAGLPHNLNRLVK